MAMTVAGYQVDMEFVDSGGTTTHRRIALQSADIAAAETDGAAVAAAFQALTRCYMLGFTIGQIVKNDDPTGPPAFPPAGDVLVSDEALIVLNLTTIGKKASYTIPAPVDGMFAGATGKKHNQVVGTYAALAALNIMFESGNEAFISDGENASGSAPFADGYRVSRGRQLNT